MLHQIQEASAHYQESLENLLQHRLQKSHHLFFLQSQQVADRLFLMVFQLDSMYLFVSEDSQSLH